MPSNKRQALHEKVDQVIGKSDKCKDELVELGNKFMEQHEDYGNTCFLIAAKYEELSTLCRALRSSI